MRRRRKGVGPVSSSFLVPFSLLDHSGKSAMGEYEAVKKCPWWEGEGDKGTLKLPPFLRFIL